jgi:hypothetical protein
VAAHITEEAEEARRGDKFQKYTIFKQIKIYHVLKN